MHIEQTIKYNRIGQEVTIKVQTNYEDLEVLEFPESCSKCPVGFPKDCGRNAPLTDEDYKRRPDTCKLKKIDYQTVIDSLPKGDK